MDIKKSNVLEDRFKLSSFSLKIYNVNAGNIIYAFGSAHHKFDVWIEVDLLPSYSTSSKSARSEYFLRKWNQIST